mmetsp:Transcript_3863/g.10991  ORF Transcript_3863/g.10991 Transcript_3863/m.10991 type:complete len:250 (+) Transcript_3863:1243-1992(+)
MPRPRDRGAVRGQVLRARRPHHPDAAARGLLPGRHRGVLQRGPPGVGEDHGPRRLHRGTGEEPTAVPRGRGADGQPRGRGGAGQPEPADESPAGAADPVPHQDAPVAHRHHHRRQGHRAREARGAARDGRLAARLHGRPRHLLRGAREDAEGLRERQLRAHDGRPHGQLRAPLPEARLLHGDPRQGEPGQGRDGVLQKVRRLLPRQHRRRRRQPRRARDQERDRRRVRGAGDGSRLVHRGCRLPGVHHR